MSADPLKARIKAGWIDLDVRSWAYLMCEWLRPYCHRIEVAGSCRRGKAQPNDLELVCIPIITSQPELDLLGPTGHQITTNRLEESLPGLMTEHGWEFDPKLKRNGPSYKRLRHTTVQNSRGELVCLDLYLTTPEKWGCIFTIRTGPAEFSKRLVTQCKSKDLSFSGGRIWRLGDDRELYALETPEEADVFREVGWDYVEPKDRR